MASAPTTSSAPSQPSTTAANYYQTNPQRRSLLGHISLGVRSYTASKPFYTSLLLPLGVHLVFDSPTRKILGFGIDEHHEVLNIFEVGDEARAPGRGTHIAFNAPSREAVTQFWEKGVQSGGKSDGEPGIREGYGRGYFAAYLWDLDGVKLEAVFQD
jgi:catechol 2,3-dioxygenase-like lactoylglutathione lyase family enzyme